MMTLTRSLTVIACLSGLAHLAAGQASAPVLDVSGQSLTSYLATSKTPVQNLRPRFDQRGVDIDGNLRSGVPLGWALAGDPFSSGYLNARNIGDVSLQTGMYSTVDVDIAMPTLGMPIVIGRTYNGLQVDSTGTRYDSNGYQGWNWSQTAQPELVFKAGATADKDTVYLVYGADRYVEFQRTGASSTYFKSKNGAAGVISATGTGPDAYAYIDQRGNTMTFAGSTGGTSAWQLTSMADVAGNSATYTYDASSRVATIFDASGRRYTFTYGTFGGYGRVSQVKVEIQSGGSWASPILVNKVDYDYYTTTDAGKGLAGDLRLVTVTTPVTGSADLVRRKYFRYYTGTWTNADGSRGSAHALKMVLGFEGARNFDFAGDSTFNQSYYTATDAALKPYADTYMEYVSEADRRVATAFFNGSCGCAGGINGLFSFSYTDSAGYTSAILNTTYDTAWARRTVVAQPDGTFSTSYFDEAGQSLGRVLTNTDPSGTPTKTWVDWVDRNASGQVTAMYSPASISGYTHSTGTVTKSSSAGLVTSITRLTTGNFAGLLQNTAVKQGTAGAATTVNAVTLNERQLSVGTTGVSAPYIATSSIYPNGSAETTTYAYTYWSSTTTAPLYLTPKSISTTNPVVTTGNNGSGSATIAYQYLRQDGSTAFTKDASGVYSYTGRSSFGQTAKTIADCNTALTSDYLSGDAPSTWSLSSLSSALHVSRSWTYDNQSRPLTATQPGVNGTRTSGWSYTTLADGRFGTFAYPRIVGSQYYGPVSYTLVNHRGKSERTATIALGSAGSATPPSTTHSDSTWTRMIDTIYDYSGGRANETRTYTSTTAYDTALTGYDPMGRVWRSQDITGTIQRTVFDERGMAIQSWIGTCDSSFSGGIPGTDNMVKTESREYDSNLGGGNGLLTKVTRDPDGNWSTTTDQRVTTLTYDFRNRAIVQINPLAPHTVSKYDNMNRTTAVGQYSSSTGLTASSDPTSLATNRIALSESAYDQRGQVYRGTHWEIVQSTGSKGSSLLTDNWYDMNGRLVKTTGERITKTAYDTLGRVIQQYVISSTGDTNYTTAISLTGDKVLEQTTIGRDAGTGLPLIQYTIQRVGEPFYDGTLDLNSDNNLLSVSNGEVQGRIQITCTWYDDLDRVADTVNYGALASPVASLNRVGLACPARSDTALRTSTVYDDFGRVWKTLDPIGVSGIEYRSEYDFAGRRIKSIDNYIDGVPGGMNAAGNSDEQDRVTEFTYSTGLMTQQSRRMTSSADDQVSSYTYNTTTGGSILKANNIAASVVLPEQTSGQSSTDRTQSTTYNALGEVLTSKDLAGNVLTNTYDLRGRIVAVEATTIASGFDSTVKRIETAFNTRGMVSGVLQKNASGTILDEIAYTYDNWGNIASITQDPDSAITGGTGRASYALTYTYASAGNGDSWRVLYLTQYTQPGGVTIAPSYGSSGRDFETRRVTSLFNSTFTDFYGSYKYIGAGTLVYQALGNSGNMIGASYDFLTGDPNISSLYQRNDAFNRPLKCDWVKNATGYASPVNIDLGYDRAGNVVYTQDNVLLNASGTRNFDTLSTYDNLRRFITRQEGSLDATRTSVTSGTLSRSQSFTRLLSGKASSDLTDLNGNASCIDGPLLSSFGGEMDDSRTGSGNINKRNELRTRNVCDVTTPGLPRRTISLAYDRNGNLTDDGELYSYVFDAFNRLVQVKNRNTTTLLAKYTYNGLGQRNCEQYDCSSSVNPGSPDDVLDTSDPLFFIALDQQGRRVATFRGTDANPKETFLYHFNGSSPGSGPGFVAGAVLLRDRNASLTNPALWATETASATRAERYFYCTDPRGSTLALISASGSLAEQVRYSATGVPYALPQGDVDGDGAVTSSDVSIVSNTTYQVRKDMNLDGAVNAVDQGVVAGNVGIAAGRGTTSSSVLSNRISLNSTQSERVQPTSYFANGTTYNSRLAMTTTTTKRRLSAGRAVASQRVLYDYNNLPDDGSAWPSNPRPPAEPAEPSVPVQKCDTSDNTSVCKCLSSTGLGMPFFHHTYLYFPGDVRYKYGCGMTGSSGTNSGSSSGSSDKKAENTNQARGFAPVKSNNYGRMFAGEWDTPSSSGGDGVPTEKNGAACYKVVNQDGSNLTSEQRRIITECICSDFRNEGGYDIINNNCHTKVDECIEKGGAVKPVDGRIGPMPKCTAM